MHHHEPASDAIDMTPRWTRFVLTACLAGLSGCAAIPGEGDAYDAVTRATPAMAPANPARGTQTMRVTTVVPPGLDVRLLTFYSQFHPPRLSDMRSLPRGGQLAPGCWWSQTALLQEERHYYTRVFHHPVKTGTQVQDLVLDDILPGTCHFGLTGIGYEVSLQPSPGEAPLRYRVTLDTAVQDGGSPAAEAVVRCSVAAAGENGAKRLVCARDDRRETFIAGPLAPVGAALKLAFRLEGAPGR